MFEREWAEALERRVGQVPIWMRCDWSRVDLTHQELKSSLGQSPDEPVLGTEETVNRTNRAADLASDTAYREGFEATPGDKFLGRVEEGQSSLLVVQAWSSHTLQV